jgi:ATP-dependent Lon protease
MTRTYLDWLIAMPWSKPDPEQLDIERRARILDEDHYGLEKIKRRIIEYLAVRKLAARQGADPVLRRAARRRQDLARPVDRARHGPQVRAREPRRRARRGGDPRPSAHLYRRAAGQHHPGDPQGRRAQLRDDARRDRQARRRHPGRSVRGAARSARSRAEQHVPRQLSRVPFDCRRVVFIAPPTCSTPFPAPLRDRMEIISLAGYTADEKLQIAHAIWSAAAGGERPEAGQVEIDDEALRDIIVDYTREAGVRNSSARSARCCATPRCASPKGKRTDPHRRAERSVRDPRRAALRERDGDAHQRAGRGHGLAWTPVGGDILFIEATRARLRQG